MDKLEDALKKACQEPTLLDALSWIAVWESERVVRQAGKSLYEGIHTGSNGAGWDTCFKFCFKMVMERFEEQPHKDHSDDIPVSPAKVKESKGDSNEVPPTADEEKNITFIDVVKYCEEHNYELYPKEPDKDAEKKGN